VSIRSYFKAKITRLRHQDEIRAYLGYFELSPASVITVIRVLFNRLKVCEENEAVLLDLVTRTLLEKRVVLPGATTWAMPNHCRSCPFITVVADPTSVTRPFASAWSQTTSINAPRGEA
jgi:hypothetical protein